MYGIEQLEELLSDILDSMLLKKTAKVYKALLDAFMDEGFSRQEAVEILSRQGAIKASQ